MTSNQNENYNEKKASLFEKLRHNFNKLVVIRKVKNLNPDRLEGVINQIELALSQKNYQENIQNLRKFPQISEIKKYKNQQNKVI